MFQNPVCQEQFLQKGMRKSSSIKTFPVPLKVELYSGMSWPKSSLLPSPNSEASKRQLCLNIHFPDSSQPPLSHFQLPCLGQPTAELLLQVWGPGREAELQPRGELGREPLLLRNFEEIRERTVFWSPRRLDAHCPSFIVTCWVVWWAPHLNSGITTKGSFCSPKPVRSWYSQHSKAGLKQDMKHV